MTETSKRALTYHLEPATYLNYAAVSPPIVPVQQAIRACLDDYAARGVGAVMTWVEARERLKCQLAEFLGASSPDEFALVTNTSTGVVCVANAIDWQPGDEIVLFDQEFPTNTVPWQRAAHTYDLELRWVSTQETVESGGENLADSLSERTRLVAVSAVQFQTGWRMPVARIGELAADIGAETFVDAIQACGVVPLDFSSWGVRYVACGGHKWMMGLEGAGFLWCRQDTWEALVPRLAGWLSTEEPLKFLFEGPGELRYDRPLKSDPSLFEFGATNALGYAGLAASVEQLASIGVHEIWASVDAYLDQLEDGFSERGVETTRRRDARSGILSVRPPQGHSVAEIVEFFEDRSIAISSPDGYLRFAPHWPNESEEIEQILSTWDEIQS